MKEVQLEMDVAKEHLNPMGYLHEGCLATLVNIVTTAAVTAGKVGALGVMVDLTISLVN